MDSKIKETIQNLSAKAESFLPNSSQETPLEKKLTQFPEHIESVLAPQERADSAMQSARQALQQTSVAQKTQQSSKPEIVLRVESILEDGLSDEFVKMSPAKKMEFKRVGETTAAAIVALLESAKYQTRKIFELIIYWLKIIPGINKFFLEQEAKIKTDLIIAFNEENKKQK